MIKKKTVEIIALLMVLVLSLCACKPDFVGNKYKTNNKYVLSFSALNKTEKEELYFEKGDGLEVSIELTEGEALVKAISDKTKREFGNIKVAFDISCVAFSIILSLIFFDMRIVGTRKGTVLSAVLTGFVIRFFSSLLKEKIERILVK